MKQPLAGDSLRKGRRHTRRLGGFQTVELNLNGWSALIGSGVVLGALSAWITGVVWWLALLMGVVSVWGVLLVLDHLRWRNSTAQLGYGGLDAESGAILVAQLKEIGIDATYREYPVDEIDGGGVQRGIVCKQKDVATVERLMAEHLAADLGPP